MSIEKRTTKRGETRYDVRLRDLSGRSYMRTFRLKKDAIAFEVAERADRSRGVWTDPRGGAMTVRRWSEQWLALPGRRPKTVADYERVVRVEVLPVLGDRPLGSITPGDIQALVRTWSDRLAPASVASYFRVVRALFGAAVDADLIGRSPCRKVRMPSGPPRPRRIMTPAELLALADEVGPVWRCAVLIGGVMGLRLGEVLGLTVGDVDTLGQVLHVRQQALEVDGRVTVGPPKTRAGVRSLAMPEGLAWELAGHLSRRGWTAVDGGRYLFGPGDGAAPMHQSNFRHQVFAPAVRRLGHEDVTFHGLRHTSASWLVAAGVDPKTVQSRLGHASLQVTLGLYAKPMGEADRSAADVAGALVFGDAARDGSAIGSRTEGGRTRGNGQ